MKDKILTESVEFGWDDGNLHKNAKKHDVLWQECEEVFFNESLFFLKMKDILRQKEECLFLEKQILKRKYLLRLPAGLLNEIKILANRDDVPYQSLIKIFLMQSVHAARK